MSIFLKCLQIGVLLVGLNGCGGGTSPTDTLPTDTLPIDTLPIDTPSPTPSFVVFESYADSNGSTTAPTVDDYEHIHVTGVNSSNIDKINSYIKFLKSGDVDSASELQTIVDNIDTLAKDSDDDGIPDGIDSNTYAPKIISSNIATVSENQVSAITVVATDADGDTLDYTISAGVDKDAFNINNTTGVVAFRQAPDYEIKTGYSFTVTASDGSKSATQDITITIRDVDEVKPVITLTGDNPATVMLNVIYHDPGATATDDVDGDLTSAISVDNGVNTAIVGSYTITYSVMDRAGNTAIAVRNVEVTWSIKKTGQTKSFNSSDVEVSDGSVKDDGYYQTGVTPHYTREDGEEIVIDHITGLLWQDNAEVKTVTKQWLTQSNYDAKAYDDTEGDTAATYCSNLTLGGYSWRLPTITELKDIVNYSKPGVTIDDTFINTKPGSYWSSTDVVATSNSAAWIVLFSNGSSGFWPQKNKYNYVRCVSEGKVD